MAYFWRMTPTELEALDDQTYLSFREFMVTQSKRRAG